MTLKSLKQLLVSFSVFACTSVFATPLVVNVAGIQSAGLLFNPGNVVLMFDIGAGATITSVTYDVKLIASTPSWLSEMKLAFTDSAFATGVLLTPGVGVTHPGTAGFADSIDLTAAGLSFAVGADGILRLEFYEGYDDVAGVDGVWNSGSISFNVEGGTVGPSGNVPEPPIDWLMGAGLALATYFGRRHGNVSKNIT